MESTGRIWVFFKYYFFSFILVILFLCHKLESFKLKSSKKKNFLFLCEISLKGNESIHFFVVTKYLNYAMLSTHFQKKTNKIHRLERKTVNFNPILNFGSFSIIQHEELNVGLYTWCILSNSYPWLNGILLSSQIWLESHTKHTHF